MADRQEEDRNGLYLRRDLPEEDYDRLVRELRADPGLLCDLLRQTSREDETHSALLLFKGTGVSEQDELDLKLRQYLLRDPALPPEDADVLEDLLVEDERYLERLLLTENELVEDYLRGALNAEEARRFDSNFLITPERREKLRYLRTLAASAPAVSIDEAAQPAPATETSSLWQSLLDFLRAPGMLLAGTAAAAILLLSLALLLWLNRPPARQTPALAESPGETQNSSPSPVTRQLNSNTLDTTPRATPSTNPTPEPLRKNPTPGQRPPRPAQAPAPQPRTVFALVSGILRGEAVGTAGKRIEGGSKLVELRLRLDLEQSYGDYRVVIENSEGKEVARRERLKATMADGLQTVAVALPAARFEPDDYTVTLSGRARGGYTEVDRYSFRVLK